MVISDFRGLVRSYFLVIGPLDQFLEFRQLLHLELQLGDGNLSIDATRNFLLGAEQPGSDNLKL